MHWLYIMPFDRLLAALVLIKYKAIFVAILLSNYQKSVLFYLLVVCFSIAIDKHMYMSCIQVSFKSLSYTFTILATIHHDSSRFEQDDKIENHWDLNPASIVVSHDAPKISARYIYGPTRLHDGSAMIHHGGATNAHDASKIRYSASIVQAGSATTFPHAVFLMNRDESEWVGMSVIRQFIPNVHEWPRLHIPYLKYEPGAATVELGFRPRSQSTTIQPECFKRFKTAVACRGLRSPNHQDSSRITTVLLRFTPMSLRRCYESYRCITI